MNLTVKIKNVYGNEMIYPTCEKGLLLASLMGKKTFSNQDVLTLKKLGYAFQVEGATL